MASIIRKIKSFALPMRVTGKYMTKKPFTVMYPREKAVVKEKWRGLHELYFNKCIGCGLCRMACPNKCIDYIYPEGLDPRDKKQLKFRRPAIDWGHCIFCGLCVEACPTGAIHHTTQYKIYATSDSRLDLIKTPYEIAVEQDKKKTYENELLKIRELMQTDLLETAVGGEWEEIIKKLREKWRDLWYMKLDGKLDDKTWDKKAREIETVVLDIIKQVSLP